MLVRESETSEDPFGIAGEQQADHGERQLDEDEAESSRQRVPVAVTVIDIHGNVVLTHRMTGAPAFSLELAERKAYTSALIGVRTADLVPLVQPGAR